MWNFIKQDLAELVSTVQEDTHLVLGRVEASQQTKKQTAALREAERRMTMEETYMVPLLYAEEVLDDENKAAADVSGDSNDESNEQDGAAENRSTENDQENVALLTDQDAEEVQRIEEFLADFQLDEKTDEIAQLLEQHPDTLRAHFEDLVPDVLSYADFWQRYFYRCDPVRIEAEWQLDEERARLARQELVGKVSNLLGGAAKAVAAGVTNALTEDDQGHPGQAPTPHVRRPPFVLNTAVDEDEEDEELGWDDEDEDDDKEGLLSSGGASGITSSSVSACNGNEDSEEQIEFKDEKFDLVNEQLKQALEERDQLHQTVELQKQELIHLKEAASKGTAGGGASMDEVEIYRSRLQATETELQALKESSVESTKLVDLVDSSQLQKLTSMLAEKEEALRQLQNTAEASQSQIAALRQENFELKKAANDNEKALIDANKRNTAIQTELQALQSQLAVAKNNASALQKESASTHEAQHSSSDGGNSGETRSTISSGVKVENPTAAVVSKIVTDEEDEGWGDEW